MEGGMGPNNEFFLKQLAKAPVHLPESFVSADHRTVVSCGLSADCFSGRNWMLGNTTATPRTISVKKGNNIMNIHLVYKCRSFS